MRDGEHLEPPEDVGNRPLRALTSSWLEALRNPDAIDLPAHPGLVMFRIGDRECAFRATEVDGVGPVGFTHRVPHRQATLFLGLAAIEGDLVPRGDLGALLGCPTTSADDRIPRLVTLEHPAGGTGRWCMVVDLVHGIEMIDPDTYRPSTDDQPHVEAIVPTPRGDTMLLRADEIRDQFDGALA